VILKLIYTESKDALFLAFFVMLLLPYFWFSLAIAVKESASVGNKLAKGVDDLDFFIGDETQDKPNYAIKVSEK